MQLLLFFDSCELCSHPEERVGRMSTRQLARHFPHFFAIPLIPDPIRDNVSAALAVLPTSKLTIFKERVLSFRLFASMAVQYAAVRNHNTPYMGLLVLDR